MCFIVTTKRGIVHKLLAGSLEDAEQRANKKYPHWQELKYANPEDTIVDVMS